MIELVCRARVALKTRLCQRNIQELGFLFRFDLAAHTRQSSLRIYRASRRIRMKPAAAAAQVVVLFQIGLLVPAFGTYLSLYGADVAGYKTVSLTKYKSLLDFLPSAIPLAAGLDLQGTSAYTDSSISPAPSSQCLTTSISLFTDCQPFLKVLVDNGGSLTGTTILGLLTVAGNTTTDSVCLTATLNFLNQGCTCSLTVYNLLQSFPTTTVPQLLKIAVNVLAQLLCPSGLVSPTPVTAPPTSTSSAAAVTATGTSSTPFAPLPPVTTAGSPSVPVPPTVATATAAAAAFAPPLAPPPPPLTP